MVQALPSNRAYEPLDVWILPGTSWGCENLLDTQRLDPQLNLSTVSREHYLPISATTMNREPT